MKQHLLTAIAFLPLVNAASAALTLTASPTEDAFVTTGVSNANADNNYGGAGALGIAGSASSKGEFQSVIRFNMASIVSSFDAEYGIGQWQIDSVTLRLNSAAANNPIFNAITAGSFSIEWMQDDSWTGGTGNPGAPTTTGVTFNSLQGLLSGADTSLGTFAFDGATPPVATTWTLGTPGAFVNDIKAGGNVGLHLVAADTTVAYLFNSQNNGTVGNRPLLTITGSAIPEPGPVGLLAVAGGLLLKRRRRDAACA